MKKLIYNKIDKSLINDMPLVTFPGLIEVVDLQRKVGKAVRYLLSQPILGIDTETRPSFRKGTCHKVSLLQVSTHGICFLFRLNILGLFPAIKRLLEDETVPKVGLSLHDDVHALSKLGPFKPGNFIDLQDRVKEIGIEDMSLQKIYANLFGEKISKSQRLTNWEANELSNGQKIYAATDAWSCIMIYEELLDLERTGDYELVKVEADAGKEEDVQERIP